MAKKKKKGRMKWIIIVVLVLGVIGAVFGNDSKKQEETEAEAGAESSSKDAVTGVEVLEEDTPVNDFSYDLVDNVVKLGSYKGKGPVAEISPSYEIDGKEYQTDISEFQVGRNAEALILDEGFTEVRTAIFNSSDVKSVFFPKSMVNVYDYTLSYLHPHEGDKIKIYYAGTQEEWASIFTRYERTKIEDAELGEELGEAVADKLNEMIGSEYDSSLFEYYFSASPDDLKQGMG